MSRSAALLFCLLGCNVWKAETKTLREPGAGAQGRCAVAGPGRREGRRPVGFCVGHGPAAVAAAGGEALGPHCVGELPEPQPQPQPPGLQPPRLAPEGAAPPGDAEVLRAEAPAGSEAEARGARGWHQLLLLWGTRLRASEGLFLYAVTRTRGSIFSFAPARGAAPGSPPSDPPWGLGPGHPSAKAEFGPFVVAVEEVAAASGVPPAPWDPRSVAAARHQPAAVWESFRVLSASLSDVFSRP